MKVYASEMYNGDTMENILLGVFSRPALAEQAGSNYFDVMDYTNVELIDWDYENNIHTYYYSHNHTLTITELELDKEID